MSSSPPRTRSGVQPSSRAARTQSISSCVVCGSIVFDFFQSVPCRSYFTVQPVSVVRTRNAMASRMPPMVTQAPQFLGAARDRAEGVAAGQDTGLGAADLGAVGPHGSGDEGEVERH